ncbi:MAG: adenine deaminase C-terminal domain-containing protein [Armatimonadota bacterium]|nr:adenine deaminase C-terminal domain-containing protein [Armatimonadota bacterium]
MRLSPSLEERRVLMHVALGREPADLVVRNATLVCVYTSEILPNIDVAIKGPWIAYVGPDARFAIGDHTEVVDAEKRLLTPGLVEGHTHLITRYGIEEFIRYAAPGGTTTVVTELTEMASILGVLGITAMLDALAGQPISFFATLPPLAAVAEFLEEGVPPVQYYRDLFLREDVVGLGEIYWGNLVLREDLRLLHLAHEAHRAGKVVEGHAAGARGQRLAAYVASGISSCHEPITAEEALERLRLGVYWMARDGEIRRDLDAFAPLWCQGNLELRHMILVTDSVGPRRLFRDGYLDRTLRRAIALGLDPVKAIQATTLNVAEHFRLDHLIGGIAPGRQADMILVDDLRNFRPWRVYCRGRLIAREGQLVVEPRSITFPGEAYQSVRLARPAEPQDFKVAAPLQEGEVRVRVIEMVTHLVTREGEARLPVHGGEVHIDREQDVIKVAALERCRGSGERFVGFVRGFGLQRGALASTMAWDSPCMVVVGTDARDMAVAVNRVAEIQGGAVVVDSGHVVAEFCAPIAGIMSPAPLPEIVEALDKVEQTMRHLGSALEDPLLGAEVLTTAAIPHLRLTQRGYARLRDGQLLGLFPEEDARNQRTS